jgi:hypothetical protein
VLNANRPFWVELFVLLFARFIILEHLLWQGGSYAWLLSVIGIPEMAVVYFLLSLMFDPKIRPPSEGLPE